MLRHQETRRLPYAPDQMFDLVADIARYPEFLPWVSAARVRADSGSEVTADLIVGFGGFKERFKSTVRVERPHRLTVEYLEGPLKFLNNEWTFAPDGTGGCRLGFRVEFAFRSRVLQALAARVFDRAVRRAIGAFEERARVLYAGSSGINSSSAHSAA